MFEVISQIILMSYLLMGASSQKMLELYDYFRSGAAYRTRIALNLKELEYKQISIHLTKDGGEQFSSAYSQINPQNLVPTLVHDGLKISQSMAIMEYIEESFPEPSLLPDDREGRAIVRALANMIACDIHPLNNLRVRLYLVEEMGLSNDHRKQWIAHWIELGFNAYEQMLSSKQVKGPFSYGESPTIADACLIPQIASARLYDVDLKSFVNILKVEKECNKHSAFEKALPSNQRDAD